jgi:hypothetical protein
LGFENSQKAELNGSAIGATASDQVECREFDSSLLVADMFGCTGFGRRGTSQLQA